jgi:hypothetical protein
MKPVVKDCWQEAARDTSGSGEAVCGEAVLKNGRGAMFRDNAVRVVDTCVRQYPLRTLEERDGGKMFAYGNDQGDDDHGARLRGVREDGRPVGASAALPGVRERRVLRLVEE